MNTTRRAAPFSCPRSNRGRSAASRSPLISQEGVFLSYRQKQKLEPTEVFPPGNKTQLQVLLRSSLLDIWFVVFLSQVSCTVCDFCLTKINPNT